MAAESPTFELFSSLRYDPQLVDLASNTSLQDATTSASVTGVGSPFYMLPYHRDRILQAARHFRWEAAASKISGSEGFTLLLETLKTAVEDQPSGPLRVKTLLSHDGTIKIEAGPTPAVTPFNLFPARLPPPKSGTAPLKVSPLTGGILTLGEDDSVHGDPPTTHPWDVLIDTVGTQPSSYTSYKTTSRDMYTLARQNVGIKDFTEQREVLLVSDKNGEIMEGSLTTVYFWRKGSWVTPSIKDGGQIGTTRRWAIEKQLCIEGTVKINELIDGEECWISNGVRGFQYGRIKLRT